MSMNKVSVQDAQVTVLLEVGGQIHLVGMEKARLDAIQALIKGATEVAIPTKRTQKELNSFLNYNG